MKRAFSAISFAVLLAGCQTLSEGPSLSEIKPIVGSVTIGDFPVTNAVQRSETRTIVRKGGDYGYIDQKVELLFSIKASKDEVEYGMEITDASVNVFNLTGVPANNQAYPLKGQRFRFGYDIKNDSIRNISGFNVGSKDEQALKSLLGVLKSGFLFGKSVTQGQETFRLDMMKALGFKGAGEFIMVGRVIGQTIYKGRHVVAIKSVGEITERNISAKIDGISYVDTFTGVPVFGKLSITGLRIEGMDIEIAGVDSVDLGTAIAPSIQPSAAPSPVFKNAMTRPIAFSWEGYSTLAAGTATLEESGKSGRIGISLPNGEASCEGRYEYGATTKGTWAVACSNGMAASGTFEGLGAGKGSQGNGKDTKGRAVKFTVGAER